MFQLIFLFQLIKTIITKEIIIPFYIKYKTSKWSQLNFIEKNLFYHVFINFQIGNPIQEVPVELTLSSYLFIISGSTVYNSVYNESLSKTFHQITIKDIKRSQEIFYFNNSKNKEIEVKDLKFLLSTNTYINTPSSLGLGFKSKNEEIYDNFVVQLKTLNVINKYVWSFIYDDDEKGKIIIGKYPHEYNSTFKENNIKTTNAEIENNKFLWELLFDEITYDNFIVNDLNRKGIFDINSKFIKGPSIFRDYLLKNNFVDNKTCFENKVSPGYYYFYCNDNFNVKSFKNLVFKHKYLNNTFTLTYEDLFIKIEDKYYLLILVKSYLAFNWELGQPFIRKFNFFFDADKKLIGYYSEFDNKDNNHFMKIFLIVLFIFIIIGLFIYSKDKLKKNRKVRYNEIEDIYDYTPSKENNNDKNDKLLN